MVTSLLPDCFRRRLRKFCLRRSPHRRRLPLLIFRAMALPFSDPGDGSPFSSLPSAFFFRLSMRFPLFFFRVLASVSPCVAFFSSFEDKGAFGIPFGGAPIGVFPLFFLICCLFYLVRTAACPRIGVFSFPSFFFRWTGPPLFSPAGSWFVLAAAPSIEAIFLLF